MARLGRSYPVKVRRLAIPVLAAASTNATATPTAALIGLAAGTPTAKGGASVTALVATITVTANTPTPKGSGRPTATVASIGSAAGSVTVQARATTSVTGAAVGMAAGSPTVKVSRVATPTVASIGMAAGLPTIKVSQTATAAVASIGMAAGSPTVKVSRVATPTVAAITLAAGSVNARVAVVPVRPTVALTEAAPAIRSGARATPTVASIGMAAGTPVIKISRVATPTAAAVGLSGGVPTLHSGSVATPTAAAMSVAALSAAVRVSARPAGSSIGMAAQQSFASSSARAVAQQPPVVVDAENPTVYTGSFTVVHPTAALVGLAAGTPTVRGTAHAVAQASDVDVVSGTPVVRTAVIVTPAQASLGFVAGTPSAHTSVVVSTTQALAGVVAGTSQVAAGSVVVPTASGVEVVAGLPDVATTGGIVPEQPSVEVLAQNPSVTVQGNATVFLDSLWVDVHTDDATVIIGTSANPVPEEIPFSITAENPTVLSEAAPVVATPQAAVIGIDLGTAVLSVGTFAPARVATVTVHSSAPDVEVPGSTVPSPLTALARLSPSLVEVVEQRTTRLHGSVRIEWVPITPARHLRVRFDLNFTRRGKDQPAFAVAAGVPDRTGVMFADSSARQFLRAGVRVRTVSGPVQGTFEIRNIPDSAMGFSRAHHLETEVVEVSQQAGRTGSHVAAGLAHRPSHMRHLYATRVAVYDSVRQSGSGTSPNSVWTKSSALLDPALGVPGEMLCRLDLNFLRPGRDQLPMPVAGRATDRVGVLFCDMSPHLKAGQRIECIGGDVYGTFELRIVPDLSPDMNWVRHIEVQVTEVAQSLAGMVEY